MNVTDVYT